MTEKESLIVTVLGDTACIDGVDNDGDSLIDFPNDPGCGSYGDDDEYNAPTTQCNDGVDNDSDGLIDYPDDTGCDDANDDNEYTYSPPPSGGGGGGGGDPKKTTVLFQGLTFPNAELTLLKSGQMAKTDEADSDGRFELRLSDISEGQYNFSLYASDSENVRTITSSFNVLVEEDVTTSVRGIYIPPTIKLNKSQVKKGNTLHIDGYAFSSSTVEVYVNSELEPMETVFSGIDGSWEYSLSSNSVGYGDHTVRVKAKREKYESTFSSVLNFKVGLSDVFEIVTENCGSKADLNDDCRVNLVDFSIAVFWYKKENPPSQVDMNSDTVVDIKDFSIMAFHWTG